MVTKLKILYTVVFVTMITVVTWAARKESLFAIPAPVSNDPWFIATLFDAYFGFLAFFIWVAYREKSLALKASWFIAIACLGNIAMSSYVLLALFRLRKGEGADKLFSSKSSHP